MTSGVTAAWQRLTLRARLLLVEVIALAVALAVGSAALYGVLTVVSYRNLDQAAQATAAEVATMVGQNRLPDPIPVTGSQIVQVVDARGRVLSASANADRLTALLLPAELRAAQAGAPLEIAGSRAGLSAPLRVVAVAAGSSGSSTVVVAQQFDTVQHSQRILSLALLVTAPALLAALALVTWRVIGAALRPVETMRASAEHISGARQDTRLPVPASVDEIQALAITLNSMLDRLSTARARQRAFVTDAAHELRSPLASMQLQLDVAERLGEGLELTDDLRAEVSRMTTLVEDLLILARVDAAGPDAARQGCVDLADLVAELPRRYRHGPVRVEAQAEDRTVVTARPDELRRALRNLVDNAVRHASSRVQVTAGRVGEEAVVAVSDDGTGIALEDRERVFERFVRLDEARSRDSGGSGLGLAITRELVERNGGTVRLTDSRLGGARFELALPIDRLR
jgi:signal transduction histidine kinase